MWTIFKVFIEFDIMLVLLFMFWFWSWGVWDIRALQPGIEPFAPALEI